jgi:hypothetical protein
VKTHSLFYLWFAGILITFQACVVPINTTNDTARSLGKGNVELAGSYTQYNVAAEYPASVFSNVGFRAGYGLSGKFDLKLRYENMRTPEIELRDEYWFFDRVQYLSVVPKFSLKKDKVSLSTPLSLYFLAGELDEKSETTTDFSIGPTLLYTSEIKANKIDFTAGIKSEIFQSGALIMGFSAGAGFSNNLRRWAVRPEIGYTAGLGGGVILNYGIGANFIFPARRK